MRVFLLTTRIFLSTVIFMAIANAQKLRGPIDKENESIILSDVQSSRHRERQLQFGQPKVRVVPMNVDLPYGSGLWSDCDYESNTVSTVGKGISKHTCTVHGNIADPNGAASIVAFHMSPIGQWSPENLVFCYGLYDQKECDYTLFRGGFQVHMLCCRGEIGHSQGDWNTAKEAGATAPQAGEEADENGNETP